MILLHLILWWFLLRMGPSYHLGRRLVDGLHGSHNPDQRNVEMGLLSLTQKITPSLDGNSLRYQPPPASSGWTWCLFESGETSFGDEKECSALRDVLFFEWCQCYLARVANILLSTMLAPFGGRVTHRDLYSAKWFILWESGKSIVKKAEYSWIPNWQQLAPFGQAYVNSLSPDCAAKNACTLAEFHFSMAAEKFRNSMSASNRWTAKSPVAK